MHEHLVTESAHTKPATDRADVVFVVYALPDVQHMVRVPYLADMTAADAVKVSGLLQKFPQIAADVPVLGIFGRRVAADQRLVPGDRVEICRALQRDPRDLRRAMTREGGVVGQRSGRS